MNLKKNQLNNFNPYEFKRVCNDLGFQIYAQNDSFQYVKTKSNVDVETGAVTFDYHTITETDPILYKPYIGILKQEIKKHYLSSIRNRGKTHIEKWSTREVAVEAYYKDGSIACYSQERENILAIDLDFHNKQLNEIHQFRILHKVLSFFHYKGIVFIEKSVEGRGFHIYIKSNMKLTSPLKKKVRQEIGRVLGKKIEFRTQTRALRLPFSFNYEPCFQGYTLLPIQENLKKIGIDFGKLFAPERESIFERNYNSNTNKYSLNTHKYSFNTNKRKISIYKDFPIYASNRVGGDQTMIRLAIYCINHNYSLEEYYQAVIRNNINSKDLGKWSNDRIEKECSQIYLWCHNNVSGYHKVIRKVPKTSVPYSENSFISNRNFLSTLDILYIKRITKILKLNRFFKYKKCELRLRKEYGIILREIIGYLRFQRQSKVFIKKGVFLTRQKRKYLVNTPSISYQFLKKLKKEFKLKESCQDMLKVLSLNLIIRQFKHNRLGYCFDSRHSFSRQFRLLVSNIYRHYYIIKNNIIKRTKIIFRSYPYRYNYKYFYYNQTFDLSFSQWLYGFD